jgi:hypothetical protein
VVGKTLKKTFVYHRYRPYTVKGFCAGGLERFLIIPLNDDRTYRVIDVNTGLFLSDASNLKSARLFVSKLETRIKKSAELSAVMRRLNWDRFMDVVLRGEEDEGVSVMLEAIRSVRKELGNCMLSRSVTKHLKYRLKPNYIASDGGKS